MTTRAKITDPLALWREAIDQVETGVNAYATRKMADADFARVLSGLSQWPLGVKHLIEQTQAELLKRLDLPSRSELAALAAAVQRVEDKLDQLLPPPPPHALLAAAPKRTRKPPQLQQAAAAVPQELPTAKQEATARRAPAAKRASATKKGARR